MLSGRVRARNEGRYVLGISEKNESLHFACGRSGVCATSCCLAAEGVWCTQGAPTPTSTCDGPTTQSNPLPNRERDGDGEEARAEDAAEDEQHLWHLDALEVVR